jgi:hypothetical protein
LSEAKHILVLGVARSGTTLLCAAIGAHSRVCMLDEFMGNGFRFMSGGKVKGVKLCVPNQIQPDRKWKSWFRLFHMNGVLRKSALSLSFPTSRLSLTDYRKFPDLRIVCTLRPVDDVVSSIVNRANRSRRVALRHWVDGVRIIERQVSEQRTEILLVRFDSLVADTRASLGRVCEFLGLEFEERMLQAHSFNARYRSDRIDPSKARRRDDENLAFLQGEIPADAQEAYNSLVAQAV